MVPHTMHNSSKQIVNIMPSAQFGSKDIRTGKNSTRLATTRGAHSPQTLRQPLFLTSLLVCFGKDLSSSDFWESNDGP